MARKLITFRVCDLHEGEQVREAEPVRFGIDGRVYEADACPACAARLRGVLEQFTSRAGRAAVLPGLLPGGPWLGRPPPAAGSRSQRRGSAGLRRLRR